MISPSRTPEQLADLEMLDCLRHDALVGGNDKGHQVHAGGTGHHIADKFFMPRHIDDAEAMAAGEVEVGKPQFDGDAALLFLLEPVGLDAGERPDQAGFAVIDMSGGAEDDFTHEREEWPLPDLGWENPA